MTFQVSALSQNDFVMIQITDTHLLEYPHLEFVGMHPEQSFHAVIDLMRQQHPHIDLIVHTGDLAQNPTPVTYNRYLQHMQSLGIPFFHTPGNHDDVAYFPFHESDQTQATVVELGKWCIILLNSAQPQRIDGKIADGQLAQLTRLLEQLTERHVIIACHHHPFAMESAWIDQHKLKNSSDLLETIRPFSNIKAIFLPISVFSSIEFFLSSFSFIAKFKRYSSSSFEKSSNFKNDFPFNILSPRIFYFIIYPLQ